MRESKWTWFLCRARSWLRFCVRARKLSGLNLWVKVNLGISMGIGTEVVFGVRAENDLFVVCGSIDLDFSLGVRNWIGFVSGAENHFDISTSM